MSRQEGLVAEQVGLDYLQQQGMRWITSNYHCRCGEIDLIMFDREFLVFIEVRSRKKGGYGDAMASITLQKKRKIIKTASYYLHTKGLFDKYPIRFDVLSLDGVPPRIGWIKNAFGLDY